MASKITKLIPLFDRVLVEKVAPKKEIGGILLPDSAATKFNHGRVLEVGTGKRTAEGKTIPLVVKKGDLVMLPDWGASAVKLNDKELFIVKEEEILGIVETL